MTTVVFRAVRACCVAVEMGLSASVVLSTLPRPTMLLLTPETVPVKVGLLSGALAVRAVSRFPMFSPMVAPSSGIGSGPLGVCAVPLV